LLVVTYRKCKLVSSYISSPQNRRTSTCLTSLPMNLIQIYTVLSFNSYHCTCTSSFLW